MLMGYILVSVVINTAENCNVCLDDLKPVFELPGGGVGGLNPPSCLPNPPKHDALGYPGGSASTPRRC
jgi:hypothetical protein